MYGSSSSIYGCENWIVTEGILQQLQLEAALGELAKRALRWPKHHSNLAAVTTLEMESVKS